jgi:ribosomal peptide maturation radical SAM protein 1
MPLVDESCPVQFHGAGEGVSSGPLAILISMPWEFLEAPSIQLGILQSVLERAGIRAEARSLKLAFLEHCLAQTSKRPAAERIEITDYRTAAFTHFDVGLGEWIFAVPPFAEHGECNEPYIEYLRDKGVPEEDITKALVMRSLVPAFLERCVKDIVLAAPRIVGFTAAFNQNVPSLVLARMLKLADPSLKIIFGGANCDGPMGAALHRTFPWIDVVVRGEGERVLPELARDLFAGRPVRPQPGLCYRDGERSVIIEQGAAGEIPMDEVPTPKFDEYFDRLEETSFCAEVLPSVRLPYETSRGCWWGAKSHCTFCGLNGSGMKFRSKTPERVLEELYAMAARHGQLKFQIVDNIMDMHYLQNLLPRLRDGEYDLRLFFELKANLRKEHVRLLRDSGVDHIQPGIESFSNPILRLMRKGVTALQNVRLLKWCAEYGVRVNWAIIYGCPGEPPEEYARMAQRLPSLTHLAPPMQLVRLVLDRFSPYHERPAEFGLEVIGPLSYHRFIYPADEQTLSDLAYSFEYRYSDGRDPEVYVEPLRPVIDGWQAGREQGYRSLSYRRGPGFLIIGDRRPNLEAADYTLEDREARIYLACEDGATPLEVYEVVRAAGIRDVTLEEVREFLDELLESRLVYEDGGRYLALALPAKSSVEFQGSPARTPNETL